MRRRGSAAVIWGDVRIFVCVDAEGGRGEHGAWLSIFVDDVDAVYARAVSARGWRSRGNRSTRCGACASSTCATPTGTSSASAPGTKRKKRSARMPHAGQGVPSISPCRIANQPSSAAIHARQPSAISCELLVRREPPLDRLLAEAGGDDALGPEAAPPLPLLGRGVAPRRRRAAHVGEAGGERPRAESAPGVGFGAVAPRDVVVQRQPTRERGDLRIPGHGRVVGVARRRPRRRACTRGASPAARRPDR